MNYIVHMIIYKYYIIYMVLIMYSLLFNSELCDYIIILLITFNLICKTKPTIF